MKFETKIWLSYGALAILFAWLLIALAGCGVPLGPPPGPSLGLLPPRVLEGLLFSPPVYRSPHYSAAYPLVTCSVFGSTVTCW